MVLDQELREWQQRYQLRDLNAATFELRREQQPLFERLLTTSVDTLVVGDTGSGKTLAFIVLALQHIGRGTRVVFATTTKQLVELQFVPEYFRKFTTLPPPEIVAVTGDIAIADRASAYARQPTMLVGTYHALYQDMRRGTFVWDNITLVGCDEIHHYRGHDVYCDFVARATRSGVRRLYLSATPADSKWRLTGLINCLGVRQTLVLPGKGILPSEPKLVDLDDELMWGKGRLEEVGQWCYHWLCNEMPQKQFDFMERAAGGKAVGLPDYSSRELLGQTILTMDPEENSQARYLHSRWAELNLLCWMHEALIVGGRFEFREDFAYRYGRHRIQPCGVRVPELEQPRKKEFKRLFEKRLVANNKLWAVFAQLAIGTPYEAFVHEQSWEKILGLSHTPAVGPALSAKVSDFFNSARAEMARQPALDHAKDQAMHELFTQLPLVRQGGKAIVFTYTRRHAGFLALRLNAQLAGLGYHAVAAMGARTAQQRQASVHARLDFNAGRANIMCATDYAREGVDVAAALFELRHSTRENNPGKEAQRRGRVGRSQQHGPASICHLLTRQSREPEIFDQMHHRMVSMMKAIRSKGQLLLPLE